MCYQTRRYMEDQEFMKNQQQWKQLTKSKLLKQLTFHSPSLASITNSIVESMGTCLISGSELK